MGSKVDGLAAKCAAMVDQWLMLLDSHGKKCGLGRSWLVGCGDTRGEWCVAALPGAIVFVRVGDGSTWRVSRWSLLMMYQYIEDER